MHEPRHLCLDGEVIEVIDANTEASDAREDEHPLKSVGAVLDVRGHLKLTHLGQLKLTHPRVVRRGWTT